MVTEFRFDVFDLDSVIAFGVSWLLPPARAASVFSAWQAWAPHAPKSITSIMKLGPGNNGAISMRCIGQSVGSQKELMGTLQPLIAVQQPSKPLKTAGAVIPRLRQQLRRQHHHESAYFKSKSDYVLSPLSATAIDAMLGTLAPMRAGDIAVLCDAYGGRIDDTAAADTAFPHRAGTSYCIQYYSEQRLAAVTEIYQAMRPYMPGVCYVNYCDLDLGQTPYPTAYWGANLPRLSSIKKVADPTNFFWHAQSVPLPAET